MPEGIKQFKIKCIMKICIMCKFCYRSVVSWHEPSSGAIYTFSASCTILKLNLGIVQIHDRAKPLMSTQLNMDVMLAAND